MAKACRYCHNYVEGDQDEYERHELHCAQNPDVQEKARKLGEIEPFVKTAVLKDGEITRMYWAHSTGAQDFEIDPVLATWKQTVPGQNPADPEFLRSRGFKVIFA